MYFLLVRVWLWCWLLYGVFSLCYLFYDELKWFSMLIWWVDGCLVFWDVIVGCGNKGLFFGINCCCKICCCMGGFFFVVFSFKVVYLVCVVCVEGMWGCDVLWLLICCRGVELFVVVKIVLIILIFCYCGYYFDYYLVLFFSNVLVIFFIVILFFYVYVYV